MLSNICKTLVVLPKIFASSATLATIYSFYLVNPNQNSQIIPVGVSRHNSLWNAIHAAYFGEPSLITERSCVESKGVNFDAIIIDAFV